MKSRNKVFIYNETTNHYYRGYFNLQQCDFEIATDYNVFGKSKGFFLWLCKMDNPQDNIRFKNFLISKVNFDGINSK